MKRLAVALLDAVSWVGGLVLDLYEAGQAGRECRSSGHAPSERTFPTCCSRCGYPVR